MLRKAEPSHNKPHRWKSMLIHQGWFTALYTQHLKGGYPVTLLPPPRRLVPSLGLGTTWVRQLLSGSCHYPTAVTKCNEQPSRAKANPVGGKVCSSTKGGLLRYIYSTLTRFTKFHITSPSEKTRPESWPGDYMGKATVLAVVIILPLPPNVTNNRAKATANPVGGKACSSTKGGLLRYILNTYSIHKVSQYQQESYLVVC